MNKQVVCPLYTIFTIAKKFLGQRILKTIYIYFSLVKIRNYECLDGCEENQKKNIIP